MDKKPLPENFKKKIGWVVRSYEDSGATLPNGFQKDAIQNAVGARKHRKWDGWSCKIYYTKNRLGTFLIVEDAGTTGLIGKNMHVDEINQIMAKGGQLPSEEKLARFTSMHNSGDNLTGAGLYGVGKIVYAAVSETYTYYYDSLREDNIYIANCVENGNVMERAYEGDDARNYILDVTGLSEKDAVGTRIIIQNPKDEIIESINNGELIGFIQESWWRNIAKMGGNSGIFVQGEKVDIPDYKYGSTHGKQIDTAIQVQQGYNVKHFGLYTYDKGNNIWSGISYYRLGMKIGEIEIPDLPKEIRGKYWGYIEVDEKWENELSQIEDSAHFGVSKGKKNTVQFRNLKNFASNKINELLEEWGYITSKVYQNQKLNNKMRDIADRIQEFGKQQGFENLGSGPDKPYFDVRWNNIQFPEDNSETVTTGDVISFSVRITNRYPDSKTFEVKISVVNPSSDEQISEISNEDIEIDSGEVNEKMYHHKITRENSQQYAENKIILSVKAADGGKSIEKKMSYFYDIDRPDNKRYDASLKLHECHFPVPGHRRVDFGQSLKDISYRIENKRNMTLNYQVNISIHDAETKREITKICSCTGIVQPFETEITERISEINFNTELYEQHMSEGVILLRGNLVASADDQTSSDDSNATKYSKYEKGDKITKYDFKIFLNCDEKEGRDDAFIIKCKDAPNNTRRSWYETGAERIIWINVGHPAYHMLDESETIQDHYMEEQALKQYVLLFLGEGKFDMFKENGKDFNGLDPQEAVADVFNKIEATYYEFLR